MNLFPKNHRSGSIQTPKKSDRGQERKWGKNEQLSEQKSQQKIGESRRTTGGFGSPFPPQISAQNYTMKDLVHRED